jgi:hypothetical protein
MFAFDYLRGKQKDRKRRIHGEKEWKETSKEGSEESSGGEERVEDH